MLFEEFQHQFPYAGYDVGKFAFIGDRLLGDVLLANENGMVSILTQPLKFEEKP